MALPHRTAGPRALVVGILLVGVLTWLNLYSHLRYERYLSGSALPSGAIFVFTLLLLANGMVRILAPPRALSARELALIFSMLYISAALPTAALDEILVTLVVAPSFFPVGAPRIGQFIGAPSALQVGDPAAVRLFYQGSPTAPIPWHAWLIPLGCWGLFGVLMLLSLCCLSRLFVHRWVAEERVAFPLMELPLEMMGLSERVTAGGRPIWRNPLTYLGAAIPATLIVAQQTHGYCPSFPELQQLYIWKIGEGDIPAFTAAPWTALNGFALSYSSIITGVGYLLSGEVAVSIWFFHLLVWAQLLLFAAFGLSSSAAAGVRGFNPHDWIAATEFGAAIALACGLLASIRKDLGVAIRSLWSSSVDPAPTVSPFAAWGFVLANVCLLFWSFSVGVPIGPALLFLGMLYAIVIVLGRAVAAGGLYLVDNDFSPQPMLYGLLGTGVVGNGTAAGAAHFALTGQEALFGRADMSFFYYVINDARLAREARTEGRWHALGMVAAVGVALFLGCYLIVLWCCREGAVNFHAWPLDRRVAEQFDHTVGMFHLPGADQPNPWTWGGVSAGILIGLLLSFLNRNFLWWGISPFGFVVASSWNIANYVWSSIFLGWFCAMVMRRYGGVRAYGAARPFFLGLILGEAIFFGLAALVEIGVGSRGGA